MKKPIETIIALAVYLFTVILSAVLTAGALGVFIGLVWAFAQGTKTLITGA